MDTLAPKQRLVWLDWLRLLALAAVIMSHCCDPFTFTFAEGATDPLSLSGKFWGAVWQSATRFSVPLFVCITGCLLLPVRQSMGAFYRKRIGRVLWPFLIWCVLYNLFDVVAMGCGASAETVTSFFTGASDPQGTWAEALVRLVRIPIDFSAYTTHMWYVYLVIGLYLYLPVFSAWVEKATMRQKLGMLGLWAVSLFIPMLHLININGATLTHDGQLWGTCAWNSFGMFYYVAGFSGYLLLGHVIGQMKPLPWGKTLAVAVPLPVLGYALTFIGFRYTETEAWNHADSLIYAMQPDSLVGTYTETWESCLLYCSPQVALMTLGLLLLFRHANAAPAPIGALLANLTACGFGIYLVHYFFVGVANKLVTAAGVPQAWVVPACVPVVFASAWILVALLKKLVPGKWLLG